MNRLKLILLLAASVLCGVSGWAQNYSEAYSSDFWYGSTNAAGIRSHSDRFASNKADGTFKAATAQLYGGYTGGSFMAPWEGESCWNVGVDTRAIVHLKKFSLVGSFGFEQFQGKNMCGSMFLLPEFYPVDVIEFTTGNKSLQKYTFTGGISIDLDKGWMIGVNTDFLAANYSKRKDLRHTNYRLDFTISPAAAWHKDNWDVGFNYILSKNSESVRPEEVGSSQNTYYAFLDKGISYGKYEAWTGSGVHLNEAGVQGFPVKEIINGLGVQVGWKDVFFEIVYKHSAGSVGEKQYVWYRFPGNRVSGTIGYRFDTPSVKREIRMEAGWKRQTNFETVLEKVTQGGVTNVIEHGSNKIFSREEVFINPEFVYEHPKYTLTAGIDAEINSELFFGEYPFIGSEEWYFVSGEIGVKVPLKGFLIGLDLGYGGGHESFTQRKISQDAGEQGEPFRLVEYWEKKMEYLTCQRLSLVPSIRYTFKPRVYIQADADVRCPFGVKFASPNVRYSANLRVGYEF